MKKSKRSFSTSAICEKSEGNILPLLSDAAWLTETPPTKSIAHFSKGELDSSLDITLSSSSYGVGKWVCDFSLAPSKTYHLTGSCITACQENDVFFIYTLFDKDGNTLVLRPDFTPSMARCAAKYFMEQNVPIRFCYSGNTFINNNFFYIIFNIGKIITFTATDIGNRFSLH